MTNNEMQHNCGCVCVVFVVLYFLFCFVLILENRSTLGKNKVDTAREASLKRVVHVRATGSLVQRTNVVLQPFLGSWSQQLLKYAVLRLLLSFETQNIFKISSWHFQSPLFLCLYHLSHFSLYFFSRRLTSKGFPCSFSILEFSCFPHLWQGRCLW